MEGRKRRAYQARSLGLRDPSATYTVSEGDGAEEERRRGLGVEAFAKRWERGREGESGVAEARCLAMTSPSLGIGEIEHHMCRTLRLHVLSPALLYAVFGESGPTGRGRSRSRSRSRD